MKTLVDKDLVDERGRPTRTYALTDEGWEVARRMQIAARESDAELNQSREPTTAVKERGSGNVIDLGGDLHDQEVAESHISRRRVVEPVEQSMQRETAIGGQRLGGTVTDQFGTFASSQSGNEAYSNEFRELLSRLVPVHEPDNYTEVARAIHASLQDSILALSRARVRPFERPSELPEDQPRPLEQSYVAPAFEPIRLQAGTFTVQLVVDTREIFSKENRDYLENELIKKGVRPLLRSLELGDFFWVAKCKDPNLLARYGEEGDEVALDWIVERKTLEDLIGSVKDGRFHEQKFRLRKSGVQNVIYLVEDKTLSQEHATKYHEMMDSAIASTQVVDGYFVKRSLKIDDTIRYLARMTTMLKSLYEVLFPPSPQILLTAPQPKPLHLIPSAHIHPRTYLPLLTHLRTTQPNTLHAITYASFASLASKSDGLTLRDIFLKMLMCTRLITGDKALEIQKHWSTPRALFKALEKCGGRKEMEAMLERELGKGVGRKAMGKKNFENLVEVWGGV